MFHGNNWFKEIDVNLNDLSDSEVTATFKELLDYQVLVFRNQKFTTDDYLRLGFAVGSVQGDSGVKSVSLWEDPRGVVRVGGDAVTKKPSLFSHKETLDWHLNQPSKPRNERKKLIWIYAVESTKGSRTSWLNNKLAYDDLPADIKTQVDNTKIFCGFKPGRYTNDIYFSEHLNRENPIPLVQMFGTLKGMFFSPYQTFEVVGMAEKESEEFLQYLHDHIMQEKYMVHWDWQDGDLVVSEQILTLHKRWAFEHMDKRLLWRLASDYENLTV